jgi:cation diffusion facilitator family transporter
MPTVKGRTSEQEVSQIRLVTWSGLWVNALLSLLKFIVGILGSSQAVVADAVHSLSDMSTDLAILVGVRFWSAPPDEGHPFGHRRIETLVTSGIGIALALAAGGIGLKALSSLRDADILQPSWIAIIGPVLSILVKEAMYHWTKAVGKRVRSAAVTANAWHHRSDAFSSFPVLIAVIAADINPDWAFVDHVGALIVSVFIFKVAWDVAKPALVELSEGGVTFQERKQVEEITLGVEGVHGVHAVRMRRHGSCMLVDLHILVSGEISVRKGHDISGIVKHRIIEQGPDVTDVVVHTEPND